MRQILIGTRGSKLALRQAEYIKELITKTSDYQVELKRIKTKGDKILDSPLSKIGDKGLFVKEIENALLAGEVDLAVHSMKDLPTEVPKGLIIGAMSVREDPRDVFVSKKYNNLDELPEGKTIGTGSLRRRAQLLKFRPDLKIVDVRGNLDTRLRKMNEGQFEGIILAAAGIHRLGLADVINQYIPSDIILNAVGQGSVGVEIRNDDSEMKEIANEINDKSTYWAITAERALMRKLEGGCQIPIGALGNIDNGNLKLVAIVSNLDGTSTIKDSIEGSVQKAENLGEELAERMLSSGADKILEEVLSSGIRDRNTFN